MGSEFIRSALSRLAIMSRSGRGGHYRGTIRATRIGNGTKLDNLVHIGHNVIVGDDCLICGQVGIVGSSVIGDRVVLAGQCASRTISPRAMMIAGSHEDLQPGAGRARDPRLARRRDDHENGDGPRRAPPAATG